MTPIEWVVWTDGFKWGIAAGAILGVAVLVLLATLIDRKKK